GKEAGSETFAIKTSESAESSSSVDIGGTTAIFKTTTEYKGAQAKSFGLDKEPGIKVLFAIDGEDIKMTGVSEASGKTDPSALILENLVWHHYYFLIKRYDAQKGGLQHFKALVPSLMATIPASLELKETGISLEGV